MIKIWIAWKIRRLESALYKKKYEIKEMEKELKTLKRKKSFIAYNV